MQLFVWFHLHDVVTVQQPVHLLTRYGDHFVCAFGSLEFFLGQALVVKHEAVVFP